MPVMNDAFVHLHVHSEYSLLDGACRIHALCEQVKALGQTACAVTDHGNLYAAVVFYEAAKAAGIKPIIGCEVYVAQRSRFDRDPILDGKSYHLLLLCETEEGYRNLVKLVSLANLEGFYKKPRIDWELLQKYHTGLICLSACIIGEIPRLLMDGNYEAAKETALRYQALFGKGNYYLEIQDHGIAEERQVLPLILRLSRETGIPLAATNDVHYLQRNDAALQKILLCIQTGKTIDEPTGMGFSTDQFYLKSTEEMAQLFRSVPEALTNTKRIADRCHVDFRFGERKLPCFVQEGVQDNTVYFRALCYKGMQKRYGDDPAPEVRERLAHELQVIEQMQFVDYFLIVWDFIRYARSQDIPVGPGRGSGAGSLCAYCIGITQIDPIRYNLLFERFLNVERGNMPDFDIDFCIEGRAKVKEYVIRRYGTDHVAEIIAFDTLKARAAIRDVGRVLNAPYALCDKAAKLIDWRMNIHEALTQVPELKKLIESDERLHRVMDTAAQIEGMPRHASTHAAGVVIAPAPVSDFVPLQKNDETIVTQYTMTVLDKLGLLKMDFLGLRNLTIIREAERTIARNVPGFSVSRIPTDDPAVYQLISQGNTSGVFQLESAGMRAFLMQLKPENMEDIIAALALYRPGPMDSIPTYVRNRHHPEKVQYLHPLLEDILRMTYGCIVYQEQVMQICRKLAGYSYGQADILRRAMSKKKHDIMAKERQKFLYGSGQDDGCTGAVANGVPEAVANQIFDQMESFASYAFNKSHAAAYALVAYQTAYLKTHYFGEYMAALMTSVISESSKLMSYVDECRAAGIAVLPPDVNTGEWGFSFQENQLRFGLLAIKGLGKGLIDRMVTERRSKGPFAGFVDFCRRMSACGMNKRILESLIQSGALDRLDCNRRQMLLNYEFVMESVNGVMDAGIDGQMSLFGDGEVSAEGDLRIAPTPDYDPLQKMQMEKAATGLYLSGHPLESVTALAQMLRCTSIDKLSELPDKTECSIFCLMHTIKKHRTKSGEDMAFVTLEDTTGTIEALVFPKLFGISAGRLLPDKVLYITGQISRKDDESSLICGSILSDDDFPQMLRQRQLCIKIGNSSGEAAALRRLSEVCAAYPGETEVLIYLTEQRKYAMMKPALRVDPSEKLYAALCEMFDPAAIGLIRKLQKQ